MTISDENVIENLSNYVGLVSNYYAELEREYHSQVKLSYSSIQPRMLFRGQADYSWDLRPSLFRKETNIDLTGYSWRVIQRELLTEFKRRANIYIGSSNVTPHDYD